MSPAYAGLPDFAKVVLFALAGRYGGHNNGDLSLTIKDAKTLGVMQPWKLYAGLNLLKRVDLIQSTRQGRLQSGTKLCNLFALTWRGIDKPPDKVTYDGGVSVSPLPSNRWVKWERPDDWKKAIREVSQANHGKKKIPVSTTVGKGRSSTVGTEGPKTDQPRWVKEGVVSDQPRGDTSKTLAPARTKLRINGAGVPPSESNLRLESPSKSQAADFAKTQPKQTRRRA